MTASQKGPTAPPDGCASFQSVADNVQHLLSAPESWTVRRAAAMALSVLDGGIDGPKVPREHPDRALNCEADLAPVFEALADVAASAGWRRAEVAAALVNLADNNVLRMMASDDDAHQIEEAIKTAGKPQA